MRLIVLSEDSLCKKVCDDACDGGYASRAVLSYCGGSSTGTMTRIRKKATMSKGFLESLLEGMTMNAAVQASKDASGKPDPFKAVGMLFGTKDSLPDSDLAELGTMLGAEGAFDNKD